MSGVEALFASIVGALHVRAADRERIGDRIPDTIVCPSSAGEVAACVAAARRERMALVPSGGGSKLHWGNPVAASRVVLLSLARLRGTAGLDADEGIARVPAGEPIDELCRAAAAVGRRTAFEPLHVGATVGGTIAADPVGPGYGLDRRLRDELLGLCVVLANGEIARMGGAVVKNVTGFDLVRLLGGSHGTLGVITEAIVRLRARPEASRILARDEPDAERAFADAAALRELPGELTGAALAAGDDGLRLLWRLEGREASVREIAHRVPGDEWADPTDSTIEGATAHGTEEPRAAAWPGVQRTIGSPRLDPAKGRVRVRLGARPSDAATLWNTASCTAGERSPRVALPLAGILFADVPLDALCDVFAHAHRNGWTMQIEGLPSDLASTLDAFGPSSPTLALHEALRSRFDPDGVLSPGRFLPIIRHSA